MNKARDEVVQEFYQEMERGVLQVALAYLDKHGIDEDALTPEERQQIDEVARTSAVQCAPILASISTRVKFEKVGPD